MSTKARKYPVSLRKIADIAARMWDAGEVEYVGRPLWDARSYVTDMTHAAAMTALWACAVHDDDTEGTGEYAAEVYGWAAGWSPDYADALPGDVRAGLEADVEGFIRMAWPYLSADRIGASQAGHDFTLTRNRTGAGFASRPGKHGTELARLAETFGDFTLFVTGHDDGMRVTGS